MTKEAAHLKLDAWTGPKQLPWNDFASALKNWASAVSKDLKMLMEESERLKVEEKITARHLGPESEEVDMLYAELNEVLFQNLFNIVKGDAKPFATAHRPNAWALSYTRTWQGFMTHVPLKTSLWNMQKSQGQKHG